MKSPYFALLIVAAFPAVAATAPSHCTGDERAIFSCRMARGDKVVSLCASKSLDAGEGYLQYRFGKPGAIELQYPKERNGSAAKFRYAHYMRFQVDNTEVSFSNGGIGYALYSYYNGEEKPAAQGKGVRVKERSLECRKPVVDEMMSLEGIVPCDEGNALGGCP